MNCDRMDTAKAASGWDTMTGQRTLLIASMLGILRMCVTCIGVDDESAVENVAPVTIGIATGVEFISLNFLTMAWMYML